MSGDLLIRERPPLDLSVQIETPNGSFRWASDESSVENVLTDFECTTGMPGGFESASMTLARTPDIDYPDLAEFSTLTAYDYAGDTVWQGRIDSSPRTSGDTVSITPNAVGWQAHLDDDQAVKIVYVDIDQTRWKGAGAQRKINTRTANIDIDDPATDWDGVAPCVVTGITGPWSRHRVCEAWYDAHGVVLDSLYYAWKLSPGIDSGDSNWDWQAYLSSDDVATSLAASGNLRAAGPGTGTLLTTGQQTYAMLQMGYPAASLADDTVTYSVDWTCLAVYAYTALTKRGTASATAAQGFYISDIIGHVVRTWAPLLATTRAGESTISEMPLIVPQAAYLDPTTVSAIVKDVNRAANYDWAVWEGPTFWYHAQGARGRVWRARVGPSGLQETGPSSERAFNGVIVPYTDPSGVTMTVGPTGSNATYEYDDLLDSDPENPANAAGLGRRWKVLPSIGTSSIVPHNIPKAIGMGWLAEQRQRSTAGQATLVGHVEDEHGVTYPVSAMRGGDRIVFTDAHDPIERRIVRTHFADNAKTCQIDLDSPPQGLDAALARMEMAIAPYGFA